MGKKLFCLTVCLLFFSCAKRTLQCNIVVIDFLTSKGIYIPQTSANGIDTYLKSSKDWRQLPKLKNGKLDHQSAFLAAKIGKYVIATYNGGKNSGHVVYVVGNKNMVYSSSFKAQVPYVYGSLQGAKPNIMPLSYQFSSNKENNMSYFVYKK